MLHQGIQDEVVAERDRLFMYWLRTLGIEKGMPFEPTNRQKAILEDGARVGEMMARPSSPTSGLRVCCDRTTGA